MSAIVAIMAIVQGKSTQMKVEYINYSVYASFNCAPYKDRS